MIVVNTENYVIAEAPEITRVDAQGETNLIKVNQLPEEVCGFYYIGTNDRDQYQIFNVNTPDRSKTWKYINNQFEEVIIEE